MKKKFIILLFTAMCSMSVSHATATPEEVYLSVEYTDPDLTSNENPRMPVRSPKVYLMDNSVLFKTPCDGCTLRLVDENGNITFSAVIPENCTSLSLPTFLSGEYEIQIIRGNFCFYGFIELT